MGLKDIDEGQIVSHAEVKNFMQSGYEIVWSNQSLDGLKETIEYLEDNLQIKNCKNYLEILKRNLSLISENH